MAYRLGVGQVEAILVGKIKSGDVMVGDVMYPCLETTSW